ncbi:hypothetical protein M404DRAFT_219160 [Pisolithus tinctorius Marx 270]|uniref:Uncharacterized protein n=1 Tax=Pisolithus tinctorius Marx 270 TaxID=870435 RepID=A0A0C3KJZ4_PISTI|nr:hypothetical protein M404DRAFT_219160 [Pisolithus tinctorius Marx 270]
MLTMAGSQDSKHARFSSFKAASSMDLIVSASCRVSGNISITQSFQKHELNSDTKHFRMMDVWTYSLVIESLCYDGAPLVSDESEWYRGGGKIDSSAGLRGHSSIDAVSYVVNAIPSQSSVFYASKKKTRPTVHDVTLPRTLMSNTGYLSQ